MRDRLDTWTVEVTADTEPLKRALGEATKLGDQFASRLTSAFVGAAVRGKSLEDVVRSLALSLSNLALKSALQPLENGLGGLLQGLLTGLTGAFSGATAPMPVPFAQGGVIASPITFPMGARNGLAGERGPEAILPLTRGSDGRLGISSEAPRGVSITFNITTPDADSFRRSESQITALVARATSAGRRDL